MQIVALQLFGGLIYRAIYIMCIITLYSSIVVTIHKCQPANAVYKGKRLLLVPRL